MRPVMAFALLAMVLASCPASSAAQVAPALAPTVPVPTPGRSPGGTILEQVFLSRDLSTRQPALSFGLSEKVYLVMTWKGLAEGPHSLRVSWIDPRGRVAEETLYSFVVLGRTVKYDTWVWMSVKPPEPGTVYDYGQVVGEWTVKGYLDGASVIDSRFRLERDMPAGEPAKP